MQAIKSEGGGAQAVELQPHPAAEIFPPMGPADFAALVADIKANGQREPIVIYDNQILDGRHRYRACQRLGIAPVTVEWAGPGTPESFVISRNLHRRHLDASQRAMVAAAFATLKRGGDKLSANLRKGPTAAELAAEFNVSTRSIETARVVRTKGTPELLAAVERGAIKVSAAAELVDLPRDRQRELATAGKHAISKAVKRVRRNEAVRKELAGKKSGSAFGPIDLCTMEVRRIILATIGELPPGQVEALLAELRDEFEDIEKVVKRRMAAEKTDEPVEVPKVDVISPPEASALPAAQVDR